MIDLTLRPLEAASASELLALQSEVFADYEQSEQLAEVLAQESAARPPGAPLQDRTKFGFAAFRGQTLVGWTQGYSESASQFYMLNSGVVSAERRTGVYSQLVKAVLTHAESVGYATVRSRHTAANTGVIIAKLRLGFKVSGFEYSEVYGPLVQLTYLVGSARRSLYSTRASPIRGRAIVPDMASRSLLSPAADSVLACDGF
jgi:GNAT superfamily N-acetyltransferase